MKPVLFLFLALFFLMLACSKEKGVDNPAGGISGSVSDKTTGEPVATVSVKLVPGGETVVTGEDGGYDFVNLEAGSYMVHVRKEGYKADNATIEVKAGEQVAGHFLIERIPAIVTADCDTLAFGGKSGGNILSFRIVNSGYEDLAWEITRDCRWITGVQPANGVVKHGKTGTIVVTINRELLEYADNTTVLVVKSSNGSSEVIVTAIGELRELPVLNMLEVSAVSTTSVVLHGRVEKSGIPAYTELGFVYDTLPEPALDNCLRKLTVAVTPEAEYAYILDGLTFGKTYYVRTYAKNSLGTAYSTNEDSFSTKASLPQVTTQQPTEIDVSTGVATLHGKVTNAGDPVYTERGFVYGTMSEPTVYDAKVVAGGDGAYGSYSLHVTELPKEKTYYVRAYAMNCAGIAYGNAVPVKFEYSELLVEGKRIAVQLTDKGTGTFSEATASCKNSNLGGYTDWRLQTKQELVAIYENKKVIGNFSENPNASSSCYWSSSFKTVSTVVSDPLRPGASMNGGWASKQNFYYYLHFANGDLQSTPQTNQAYSVRCVRTLQ